jgi:glycosyltransferase involved in cell wall biosynthesis
VIEVLHILCDLNGGGAERLVLDLCRLRSRDLRVRVLTIQRGGSLEAAFAAEGVPVYCADRPRRHLGIRALGRVRAQLRGADVVHTHLWAGDTFGRIAGLLEHHPAIVSTIHNTRADDTWRGWLDRRLSRLSHRLVAVSEAAEAALIEGGYSKASMTRIGNGIDLGRFCAVPLAPGRRVLAVGRLTRQKGFDVLIRALARLPDVEAEIVGEGEDRPSLEALIRETGARVRLPGWRADLGPHLAAAQVVVIPSRWEGFGLFAVEAMAAGRPVVASAVDALPGVLGEAGCFVPPDAPEPLAAALHALLDDPQEQRRRAALGLLRAPRFDVRHTVAAYESLYRSLARPPTRR